jgi:hypothetical protein
MIKVDDRKATAVPEPAGSGAYPLLAKDGSSEIGVNFLEKRTLEWSFGLVSSTGSDSDTHLPGTTAEDRLLSIFDIFHEWFQREDYEAALIIDTLLNLANGKPLEGHIDYLSELRSRLVTYATDVNFTDPNGFALSWHLLMKGAVLAAVEGDPDAALRGKQMARGLIAAFSPVISTSFDDWFGYDYDPLGATDNHVVLNLDFIGEDLMDYEAAALWADQGNHLE